MTPLRQQMIAALQLSGKGDTATAEEVERGPALGHVQRMV
jgi:hypothetical protein